MSRKKNWFYSLDFLTKKSTRPPPLEYKYSRAYKIWCFYRVKEGQKRKIARGLFFGIATELPFGYEVSAGREQYSCLRPSKGGVIVTDSNCWHTYILRCRDNTLYIGIAKDLEQRVKAHNNDRGGARYTRGRQPVRLVYAEKFPCRSTAAKREYQLKKLTRAEKENIIAEDAKTGGRSTQTPASALFHKFG